MTYLQAYTDFSVRYDENTNLPVFEGEDGSWVGIGHIEAGDFLTHIAEICRIEFDQAIFMSAKEYSQCLENVEHLWAVRVFDGEDSKYLYWGAVTEHTPYAIPVTLLRTW